MHHEAFQKVYVKMYRHTNTLPVYTRFESPNSSENSRAEQTRMETVMKEEAFGVIKHNSHTYLWFVLENHSLVTFRSYFRFWNIFVFAGILNVL